MLRFLNLSSILVVLLKELIMSNQFPLFGNKVDEGKLKHDQLLQENSSCQRNCTELDPETVLQNCPPLRRGLSCGKYRVYHYYRQCLTAAVYCRRNMTNIKEVAVYVAATGINLNTNKTGLFVLPYIDQKQFPLPQLVVEKAHHGNGNNGELVCNSNGNWVLYDINYQYEVEHLFCLVVEARNLNYLLDVPPSILTRLIL